MISEPFFFLHSPALPVRCVNVVTLFKSYVTLPGTKRINFINYLKIIIIQIYSMNLKRIFGALLSLLGIGGLIYTAVLFAGSSGGTRDIKALLIYGILGLIFFIAGISLVRTTKDES